MRLLSTYTHQQNLLVSVRNEDKMCFQAFPPFVATALCSLSLWYSVILIHRSLWDAKNRCLHLLWTLSIRQSLTNFKGWSKNPTAWNDSSLWLKLYSAYLLIFDIDYWSLLLVRDWFLFCSLFLHVFVLLSRITNTTIKLVLVLVFYSLLMEDLCLFCCIRYNSSVLSLYYIRCGYRHFGPGLWASPGQPAGSSPRSLHHWAGKRQSDLLPSGCGTRALATVHWGPAASETGGKGKCNRHKYTTATGVLSLNSFKICFMDIIDPIKNYMVE